MTVELLQFDRLGICSSRLLEMPGLGDLELVANVWETAWSVDWALDVHFPGEVLQMVAW